MKRIAQILALVLAECLVTGAAVAETASANLQVSVMIDPGCAVSTTPVAFTPYSVVGTNATVPDDSTGSVIIQCTTGVVANIGLDTGHWYAGGSNRMQDGQSHALQYGLYQDASRNTIWGNGPGSWITTPAAPNTNPQTYTVYGRIPAGQSVVSGSYADTVVATVNF